MAVLACYPYASFKCGMTCIAPETLGMSIKHHSRMAFAAPGLLPVEFMAIRARLHIIVPGGEVSQIQELFFMTGPAG